MADPTSERKKGTKIAVPIVYGTISFYMGRKAEETKTHRWTVYVRGPNGEDLSYAIKAVAFTLHNSFVNPRRVVTEHPFEVTEYGWGEFDIKIEIYFHDEKEPPISFFHALRLYPPGNIQPSTKKPVIHEFYDEIVFVDPREVFLKKVAAGPIKDAPPHPLKEFFPSYPEEDETAIFAAAQKFVEEELSAVKARLTKTDVEVRHLQDELQTLRKGRIIDI